MRTDPQVNVRLEPELLDRLKGLAKINSRSMTAELNHWLHKALPAATPNVQFKLRLPADLYNYLQEQAAENGRSVSSEVVVRLEQGRPIMGKRRAK